MSHKLFKSLTWRLLAISLTIILGTGFMASAQDKVKCSAITQAGTKCKISAHAGSAYCHIHNKSIVSTKPTCRALTKAGTPCKHVVKVSGTHCSQHKN